MTALTDASTTAAGEAAEREAVMARRTLWLSTERVVFGTGVVVSAIFPWYEWQDGVFGLRSFLLFPDQDPYLRWVGVLTVLTMALVVAALVTPGGLLGWRRRWLTVAALGLLAAVHLMVLMTYADAPLFHVSPAYWVLIVFAAASTCVWWPREDIDDVD